MMTQQEESLAKNLHMLQSDNASLRQERQEYELNLRQYVRTISEMDEQLRNFKEKNEDLTIENRDLNLRKRQQELALERMNEEYKSLYEHIHLDVRKSARGITIKELELSNSLTNIHNRNFEAAISNLRNSLQEKNQQLVELNQESAKLKMDLLICTHQYTDTINELKAQISQLKIQQKQENKSSTGVSKVSVQDRVAQEQLRSVKNELTLVEKEYQKLSAELLKCQKELTNYKREAEWLSIVKQSKELEDSPMDFHQIRTIVEENISLRKQLNLQIERYNFLVRSNPSLMSQLNQIDLASPMQELQNKYEELMTKSGEQIQQITILTHKEKSLQADNAKLEAELTNYRSQSIKVFNKLQKYINNYLPCFQLYGFEEFLQEQECKFIESTGTDIYKQYDRMSLQLTQKTNQVRKLEGKVRELENQHKAKQNTFNDESVSSAKLKEQNSKLTAVVEALTAEIRRAKTNNVRSRSNRSSNSQLQLISYQNEEDQSEYRQIQAEEQRAVGSEPDNVSPQPESQQEQYQAEHPDQSQIQRVSESQKSQEQQLEPTQAKVRVEALGELAVELTAQYEQCLSIIHEKDQLIAEANAELALLRSQSQAKSFSFEYRQPISSFSFPVQPVTNNTTQQFLAHSKEEFFNLKKEITSMSQLYESQLRLLQEQHENKYNSLNLKYVNLLTNYKDIQHKFSILENLYEEETEKKGDRKGSNRAQSEQSEEIMENEGHELMQRDEKNVISEATIQSINDLLKKYEKEFARFTSLYEQGMLKTKVIKLSAQKAQQPTEQEQLETKIQRIVGILNQNQHTIDLMQQELQNNSRKLQETKENQQQQEVQYKNQIRDLEERLKELLTELEGIREKTMQSNEEGGLIKALENNVLVTILNSKKQQIQVLEQTVKEKQDEIDKLNDRVNSLEGQINCQYSTLEQEQHRKMKDLLLKGDLFSVLQEINQAIISRKNEDSQREHQEAPVQMIEQ